MIYFLAPVSYFSVWDNFFKQFMVDKKLKIIITGDNGESLPPPYGGIMKRCLLHAKQWRQAGVQVYMHIHHKHKNEQDLDARAEYFYDFDKPANAIDKAIFVVKNLISDPLLFVKSLLLQTKLSPQTDIVFFLYCAGRAIVLKKAIKRFKPDIIISETGGFQSLVAAEVAKRAGLKIILENYAEIQFKQEKGGENIAAEYAPLWRYLLDKVDLIVPASRHCRLGPANYVDDSKIKVIYSGVNFDLFNGHIGRDKNVLRQKFNLPKNKFLVMAVGALRGRKGHDHLMEALLRMPAEEINQMGLVLCGMGKVDEVRQTAANLDFPKESLFIFQGLTEESLANLYATVDCFCFPSVTPRECMGMAMKEAMSIGLPIVAYDAGGIKEAIENGQNGFLVPVGDKSSLALAIKKIKELGVENISRIRAANIKKAGEMFDINKTSKELLNEIIRLVNL